MSWVRVALGICALCVVCTVRAEMKEINVAQQYGIGYLPLMLMEDQKLIEKYAKEAGVDVKVNWAKFAGGNVMNEALLSDSLQFASGGVGPAVETAPVGPAATKPRRRGVLPLRTDPIVPNQIRPPAAARAGGLGGRRPTGATSVASPSPPALSRPYAMMPTRRRASSAGRARRKGHVD